MARSLTLRLLVVWLGATHAPMAAADQVPLKQARINFLYAEKALEDGRLERFRELAALVEDYALHPYLRYAYLRRTLERAAPEAVGEFLETYADTPLASRLRRAWLHHLGRHGRWEDYLAFYRPQDDAALRCWHARTLLETGHPERAWAAARRLWLAGRPQPAPCNAVFAAWRAAGRLTPALLWTRIERAIRAGHVGLAGYLARYLDPGDRHWVGLWRRVHEDPTRVLSAPAFEVDHPMGRRILTYGITRQARADAVQALALWEQLKGRQAFGEGTRRRVTREIALRLALQDAPAWEECLKALGVTATAGRWGPLRLRAALELGDWQAVIDLIHRLPPDRRERPRWRYWRARSLAALGEARHAEAVYAELAATRHYYGFLAADRLGVAYPLKTRRSDDDTEALAELARAPGIRRAHELFVLERLPEARREWHYATRDMSEAELLRAARLARRWGWHDRALVTLARTRHADELDVRFPTPFRETIERHTAAHEVDPAWVYAIIRQESSFMPDVRSPSGALGLMQLLPRTGRSVAERLGTRLAHRRELLDVETNLRLGIAYLARTLEMTRGHPVLATASYNAGYGTVRGWVPRDGTVAADRWIETLPLAETRNYVRNVLAYTTVYDHRLDGETTVLTDRMPPIGIRLIH